ncbi:rRNA biogenesis protein RRP36, partial [Dillenia turbinata]
MKISKESTLNSKKKIKFEDSDDGDEHKSSSEEEEEEEKEIERELGEFTFEERLKAASDGSHSVYRKKNQEKKPARANKNRPMEVSCKKPVSRFREVIQVPKRETRDPRFESLAGKLDVDGFHKRYDFLFKDNLPAERAELQKQLKKSKDPEIKDELKNRISWIDKQIKSVPAKLTDAQILAEHKKKEREAAKQGKRPFYLKKSEIRKQILVDKYNSLKAAGKLESFIEKKRRKNAAKDHRYMPYRRPNDEIQ